MDARRWLLAAYYIGTLQLQGLASQNVTITVLGDEVIIGRAVLAHYGVFLDHGQRVIVEA